MRWLLTLFPRTFLIRFGQLAKPILRIVFKGKKYVDPIDGSAYRFFFEYGYAGRYRKNALCPGTFSLERHRLLWLYLKNETTLLKDSLKVLHFAPAQPLLKNFRLIKNWNYVTIDHSSPLADVKADICSLPFEDFSFDFILCNHVLEHVDRDDLAIGELYRILKPGGILIAMVPLDEGRDQTYENSEIISKSEREKHFGQYDHVRVYGLDYKDRLEKAGFRVELVRYAEKLSKADIKRYGLLEYEIIPVATK